MADLYGNPYTSNIGETEQAVKTYRRGLSLIASIPEGSGSVDLETARALLFRGLGEVIAIRGDAPAGVVELRRSAAVLERLFAAHPADYAVANELASVQGTLGDHLGGIGTGVMLEQDGTRKALERALELNHIVSALPAVPEDARLRALRGVAVHLLKLGNLALVTNDNIQAADRCARAAAALAKLPDSELLKSENLRLKTAILKSQAEALIGLNRPLEAAQVVSPSVDTLHELWRRDPENRQFRHGYLMVLKTRGDALLAAGRKDDAVRDFTEGERVAWELLSEDRANATSRARWGGFRSALEEAGVAPVARPNPTPPPAPTQ
jgi:hypothetical protein